MKNSKKLRDCVIVFGFRNGGAGNLCVPSSERYSVSGWQKTLILGTEKCNFLVLSAQIGVTAGYNGWK